MSNPQNAAQAMEQFKEKLGIGADKVYGAMGTYSTPRELVEAGKKMYALGYRKLDTMSPFPVHGIDEAIGVPRSKIGWIVIIAALTGLFTAQALMYYVGVINYPLIIGGKPLFDFTFTIPVTFELTVLFAGITTTVCIFGLNGLPRLYHPSMNYRNSHRTTDDQFVLIIEADDPMFQPQKASNDLRTAGASDVEVVEG
jgi:hypothetical protein